MSEPHDEAYDPTLRETFDIILNRYELSQDDKLSTLKDHQEALHGLIDVLTLALVQR